MMHSVAKLYHHRQQISLIPALISAYHAQTRPIPPNIRRICKIIKSHPYPKEPLDPTLNELKVLSSPPLTQSVLEHLRKFKVGGPKALCFFNWARQQNPQNNNMTTYEYLLHILANSYHYDLAWELLHEMKEQCHVSADAVRTILSSYVKNRPRDETINAFQRMEKYHPGGMNTPLLNIIIYYFCKWKTMKETRQVFDILQAKIPPDVSTFNILLSGFQKWGGVESSLKLFEKFIEMDFKPDTISYNILMNGFCKARRFVNAMEVLQMMKRTPGITPSGHSYTTLIRASVRFSNIDVTRQLFDEMRGEGVVPNFIGYIGLVDALCRVRLLDEMLVIIHEMDETGVPCENLPYKRIFYALARVPKPERVMLGVFDIMVRHGRFLHSVTAGELMCLSCKLIQLDLALRFWNQIMEKGFFFYDEEMEVLVGKLCSCGRWHEAYECCNQLVQKGKVPPKSLFVILKRFVKQPSWEEMLFELYDKRKELKKSIKSVESRGNGKPYRCH